jgi:hypothetical protein
VDEDSATPNHRGEADKDETEASSTKLNKQVSKGDISNEKPPKPRSSKPQKTGEARFTLTAFCVFTFLRFLIRQEF